MTPRRFYGWFIGFALVVFLMQVFPLYAIANHARPIVLGMPFSMFWVVLWIFIQFVGLLVFYRLSKKVPL